MEFDLTPQREKYLESNGKIILNACPGSGKTTSIAKKIIEIQNSNSFDFGDYCGIACLSFTNTAKDEISKKYKQLSGDEIKFPNIVSTIDSFINQYITLPFFNLLNPNYNRPKIIDDDDFLDEGWKGKFKFKKSNGQLLCFQYPPSSIRIEKNGTFTSNGYKPNSQKVSLSLFKRYAKALKNWQIKNGLLKTTDSTFLALKLLNDNPQIGKWLSKRFPYIIIDEAQDNSELQHAIFDKLVDLGLQNIELIGDPYQSLYEWREADPKLFLDKYENDTNWQSLDLTDNWRSNKRIIDAFSLLRNNDEDEIVSLVSEDRNIPVTIYKYDQNNVPSIVSHFNETCEKFDFKKYQIVVRGNDLKNRMLGKESDQEPWKEDIPYTIIELLTYFESNEIKKSITLLRKLCIQLLNPGASYSDISELQKKNKDNVELNSFLFEIIKEVPSLELSIEKWTEETEIFLKEKFEFDYDLDFGIKKRSSSKFDRSILDEPMNKHFKRSFSDDNIPITTIHSVKGKTFDAILVFFNSENHKENINFNDIESTSDFPEETKRMIYVAMSRPKHLLSMAFPDKLSNKTLKEKFGDEINIVNL